MNAFWSELHPRRFFWETWNRLEASPEGLPIIRVLLILLAVGASKYGLEQGLLLRFHWPVIPTADLLKGLAALIVQWTSYGLIPAAGLFLLLGIRPTALGLRPGQTRASVGYLCLAYGISLLAIIPASFLPVFKEYYPRYSLASRSWLDFGGSELISGFGLLAVEFFFRGVILQLLVREFGRWAPLLATVPYCLLHLGKPGPELAAAFAYSLILDTLAVRTGSLLGGWSIHWAMAISVDVLALWQRGTWIHSQLLP